MKLTTIILAGATGLVGGGVAQLLPQDGLTIIARRAVEHSDALQLSGAMHDWPRLMVGQTFDVGICTWHDNQASRIEGGVCGR